MLNVLPPNFVSSAATPVLDFWTQRSITDSDGFVFFGLTTPQALSFQIWDVRNADNPVQLFPSTGGQRHSVDLVADLVGDVAGHYAAAWTSTIGANAKGRYQIRWYYTPTAGAPEVSVAYDFDVLPAAASVMSSGTAYALVSDMRDEGVSSDVSDARILRVLNLQARYIERITSRTFRPVFKSQVFDGSGGRACLFGEPIIALVDVMLGQPATSAVQRETFRVFNRHIVNGQTEPDDRRDPKIEFAHFSDLIYGRRGSASMASPLFGIPWRDHFFPEAIQNVTVRGLWGYTDFDGGPVGKTPELIAHAQKLLVLRELPTMSGTGADDREDIRYRPRLTGEKTRDQSYTREAEINTPYTGDRAIDDILLAYQAPMRMSAA